jgi:hypothetical protein
MLESSENSLALKKTPVRCRVKTATVGFNYIAILSFNKAFYCALQGLFILGA